MSESVPPLLPPSSPTPNPQPPTLAEDPREKLPIAGMFTAFEAILREPRRITSQLRLRPTVGWMLLLVAVLSSCIYGVVVGTFSGGTQLWAAPTKVVVGLLISAGICLPSLYIFSCLSGSTARFAEVCGLVAGLLALLNILLLGFAPVAWVFSQSTDNLAAMGALHFVFLFIAMYFGVRFLNAGFAQLNGRPGGGLNVWVLIFAVVVLQMTTALRPLLGKSDLFLPTEKKFFLAHWGDSMSAAAETTGARKP